MNGQSAAIVLIRGTLNKPDPAVRLQKNQMEKYNSEEKNLFNTGSTGYVGPSAFSFTGKGQLALYLPIRAHSASYCKKESACAH